MPVINGIYTKDFPNLGRNVASTDLFVIAVPGDNVTYTASKTQLVAGLSVTVSTTSTSDGEYDTTALSIRANPVITIYDLSGVTSPATYNNTTKIISGLNPSEAFKFTYI